MGLVNLMGSAGIGSVESRIGYGDFVYSFFSTVSYHLEGQGNWGKSGLHQFVRTAQKRPLW